MCVLDAAFTMRRIPDDLKEADTDSLPAAMCGMDIGAYRNDLIAARIRPVASIRACAPYVLACRMSAWATGGDGCQVR